MFTVVLVDPLIPQNVGNIARTCAATNMELLLVGQLGFSLDDRYLKRAGLDYWEFVRIQYNPNREVYFESLDPARAYLLSSKVSQPYTQIQPQPGDSFLFGSETAGLPKWLLAKHPSACFTIPMPNRNVRSLNLATSVGIVMYQALAMHDFGIDLSNV